MTSEPRYPENPPSSSEVPSFRRIRPDIPPLPREPAVPAESRRRAAPDLRRAALKVTSATKLPTAPHHSTAVPRLWPGAAHVPGRVKVPGATKVTGGAVAALLLLAAMVAYRLGSVEISVQVDGKTTTVSTRAGSVAELLVEHGVPVEPEDLVLPPPVSRLTDGMRVVVQRARPVTVRADGETRRLRSHGRSAEDVLALAGVELRAGDRLKVNGRPWVRRHLEPAASPMALPHPKLPGTLPEQQELVDRSASADLGTEALLLASAGLGAVPRDVTLQEAPESKGGDQGSTPEGAGPPSEEPGTDQGSGDPAADQQGAEPDVLPVPDVSGTSGAPLSSQLLPGQAPEWSVEVMRAVPVVLIERGVPFVVRLAGDELGEALAAAGIHVYPEDMVLPSRDAQVQADMTVTIHRATPFMVEVDGEVREMRALAKTVGDALATAGVPLQGRDYAIPAAETELAEWATIRIVRVLEDFLVEEVAIPFSTETVADDSMPLDQTRVDRPGEPGLKTRRTKIVYENGVEVSREIEQELIEREPVSQIVAYGTQIVWRTIDTPAGPQRYWRQMRVYATSYSASRAGTPKSAAWYGRTRIGLQMRHGIVAVDPRVIPLRTNLYVPGYGIGLAGDTGGGVRNYHIDLGFDDDNYQSWHQYVDLYLLEPVPGNIPWILP